MRYEHLSDNSQANSAQCQWYCRNESEVYAYRMVAGETPVKRPICSHCAIYMDRDYWVLFKYQVVALMVTRRLENE